MSEILRHARCARQARAAVALIDWLLFVRIQPRFVILPGTEGSAGYDDYRFHWIAFLKGSAGIVVLSALVAGVATWIRS